MNLALETVHISHIHLLWPTLSKLLAPAYSVGVDEYTLEQTRQMVAEGRWIMMVIVDKDKDEIQGAMVVNVFNRPNERVLFVQAIGGKKSVNDSIMSQLKTYAASVGASTIEAAARPSMVRLLGRVGMTPKYQVLEVKL